MPNPDDHRRSYRQKNGNARQSRLEYLGGGHSRFLDHHCAVCAIQTHSENGIKQYRYFCARKKPSNQDRSTPNEHVGNLETKLERLLFENDENDRERRSNKPGEKPQTQNLRKSTASAHFAPKATRNRSLPINPRSKQGKIDILMRYVMAISTEFPSVPAIRASAARGKKA